MKQPGLFQFQICKFLQKWNSNPYLQFWQKNQPRSNFVLLYGGNENKMANETINIAGWAEVTNL